MVAPATYPLSILVNDVECISFVDYASMSFEDYARQVSYFRFTVKDPTGITPARAHTVVILSGGVVIFTGYIVELRTKKEGNGISVTYEIEAADKKIRLQKSVLGYGEYVGSDADILADLLANAYPDLSGDFDFSTGISSFADGLSLNTNGDSILAAINKLSDLTGGGAWDFDLTDTPAAFTITFDTGGYTGYTIPSTSPAVVTMDITASGNPGNALETVFIVDSQTYIEIDLGATYTITDVSFDLKYDIPQVGGVSISLYPTTYPPTGSAYDLILEYPEPGEGVWYSYSFKTDGLYTWADLDLQSFRFVIFSQFDTFPATIWIDNVVITVSGTPTTSTDLNWGALPDAAAFDLNIASSDQFAFDIDYSIGDVDDYNSITVLSTQESAIDWIYESDGVQFSFDLAMDIRDIVIYKNTGTDTSPTWTLQASGTYGTDDLTSDGGTKDVLYDVNNHWVLFDTKPPNLANSFRVTGSVLKPLAVRVEDAGTDPIYATTITSDSITTADQAVAIGVAALAKQSAVTRVEFKTYEPGLKPGKTITVTDSARGLSESLMIQRVSTKWLGASGHAQFTVECGNEEATDASAMIANNDIRSRKSILPPMASITTASILTDDSSNTMTDDSGNIMYEVA